MLTVVISDSQIISYVFLFACLHCMGLLQLMCINQLTKVGIIVILKEFFLKNLGLKYLTSQTKFQTEKHFDILRVAFSAIMTTSH